MTPKPVKRSSHFQPRLPGFRFFRDARMPCPFDRVRVAINNLLALALSHRTEHVRLADHITLMERVCPTPPRRDDTVVSLPDLQCIIQTFKRSVPDEWWDKLSCLSEHLLNPEKSRVLNRDVARRRYSTSSGWPMIVCSFTYRTSPGGAPRILRTFRTSVWSTGTEPLARPRENLAARLAAV